MLASDCTQHFARSGCVVLEAKKNKLKAKKQKREGRASKRREKKGGVGEGRF